MNILTHTRSFVVVGLVGLLVLVLFLLGRTQAPPTAPVTEATAGTPAAAAEPAPSSHLDSPLPTREGAVEAATRLTTTFDGPVLVDAKRRTELLDRHAVAATRGRLDEVFDGLEEVLAGTLGLTVDAFDDPTTVWLTIPAGWRIDRFSPTAAEVAIWNTGVILSDGLPLIPPTWRTTSVAMQWQDGAWRLEGFTSTDGPEPPAVGGTADARVRARAMNEFTPYLHVVSDGAEQAS